MTGIIDIGSNSVRLMLVKNGAASEKYLCTTRLAEGKKNGRLDTIRMETTARAVSEFCKKARELGAGQVFAFATAGIRNAVNGAFFVERVKELCRLNVDVVSGEREAELGVKGALGDKDGGIIDIGGGSTEIAVVKNGVIVYEKSLPFGAVVLTDAFGQNAEKIEEHLKTAVKEYGTVPKADFCCIGGSCTSLAAIDLGLTDYDRSKVDGSVITRERLIRLSDEICATPVEERLKYRSLKKSRADVIHAGALILKTVMNYLGLAKVTARESDNLEGYYKYLQGENLLEQKD